MDINNQIANVKKEINQVPYTINQLSTLEMRIIAEKTAMQIIDKIRGHGSPYDVIGIAYLFYKLLNSNDNKLSSSLDPEETAKIQLERFRSGEIMLNPYILNTLLPQINRSFVRAYKIYEEIGDHDDIYAAIVLLFDNYLSSIVGKTAGEYSTSDSLVELAQAILNIQDNDEVADICCGNGNFIIKSYGIKPKAKYSGYELNINCTATLAMKADILGVNPTMVMGDVEYTLSDKSIKFDKIFSNYPLNLWLERYGQIAPTLPFKIGKNASDWYFNNVVMEHLAENGRAVTIAGAGSTWNATGKEAREYFIENGYIEAVISLPGGLMSNSSIPLTIYVFSHNNENIRLINAEDIITIRDRYNKSLSDKNIKEIIDLLDGNPKKSITITKEEAKAKDYSLAFRTYGLSLPKYENGTPISEVADIIRGTLNPRKSTTTKNTGKYLLQISDLENGSIKKDLDDDRFIDANELRPEQRLLPYDIVISRIGQPPVKAAIVSPNEERELYPNGNMYVIRTKNMSVNPYYLLSFLLSRDGQEALSCASTGSVIRIISVGALSRLIFPLKDATEQRKIAEAISESMVQYEAYTHKADLAKIQIENAYYYEEED